MHYLEISIKSAVSHDKFFRVALSKGHLNMEKSIIKELIIFSNPADLVDIENSDQKFTALAQNNNIVTGTGRSLLAPYSIFSNDKPLATVMASTGHLLMNTAPAHSILDMSTLGISTMEASGIEVIFQRANSKLSLSINGWNVSLSHREAAVAKLLESYHFFKDKLKSISCGIPPEKTSNERSFTIESMAAVIDIIELLAKAEASGQDFCYKYQNKEV